MKKSKKDIIKLTYQLYPNFDNLENFQKYGIWQEILLIEYYEGKSITKKQLENWVFPFDKKTPTKKSN